MAAAPESTPVAQIVERLRQTFNSHVTKEYEFRKSTLESVLRMLENHEQEFEQALQKDLGKPTFEGSLYEVVPSATEARRFISELQNWMQPEKVPSPLGLLPGSSYVYKEPYGVVLVIGPFNFPLQLCLLPMLAAVGAGNTVLIKPSELTPNVSKALSTLLPKYVKPEVVSVVEGGADVTQALLRQKFDHIFFTGSERIGKIVMRAAAEHLTPVTLELGGKSPTYIDQSADLAVAARRVVWGKTVNAGQICIAPDYVMVHQKVEKEFTQLLQQAIVQFYGKDPSRSSDFGRIIHQGHAQRLASLLNDQKIQVVHGGQFNVENRYVSPTIVKVLSPEAKCMQEEIFGPILPILVVKDANDALKYIHSKAKPLALYVFANDQQVQQLFLHKTSSGGMCVNDVLMHFTNFHLPFGGVGPSGMGAYHGKHGFDTFSHKKSVVFKSNHLDAPQRYPPYTAGNHKLMKYIFQIYRVNSESAFNLIKAVMLPIIAIALTRRFGSRL